MTKQNENNAKIIFFAYQGKYPGVANENVDAIKAAVDLFNKHQHYYIAKTWEDYKSITFISVEVLQAIKDCEVFACDITRFNHNVLFELGYAIARKKKILILLNKNMAGEADKYRNFILRDIRYQEFTSHKEIHKALQERLFESELINVVRKYETKATSDIFYKQSKITNQHSLELTEAINSYQAIGREVMSDDGYEVRFRTIKWYFQALFRAKNIIIHFLNVEHEGAWDENGANSFYAGFSCGLDKNVLLLAPSKYRAPLDYYDILIPYLESRDLIGSVRAWLDERLPEISVLKIDEKEEKETNLLKLGIGCEVAEHEKANLLSYFVETASYERALTGKKILIVGTKGSGKSAIYIKLLNEFARKDTYLIGLKPDSDDLIENVKKGKLYSNESRITYFVFVWRVLIYSNVLKCIRDEIKERPPQANITSEEQEILKYCDQHAETMEKNFFGIACDICQRIEGPEFLEELNNRYLSPIIKMIKTYFVLHSRKYIHLVIMADGLDKTWDSKHELNIQSDMIETLLDVEDKIEKELVTGKDNKVDLKQVVFIRRDIYEYIYKRSSEKDKLISVKHEIDWNLYPNLLKIMVENRFKTILNLPSAEEARRVWGEYFNFGKESNAFSVVERIVEKRPRDVIYFLMMLFEAGFNNGVTKIGINELEYATKIYCEYLLGYVITELSPEYPSVDEFVDRIKVLNLKVFKLRELEKIKKSMKMSQEDYEEVLSILMGNEYLAFCEKNENYSCDLGEFSIARKKRVLGIFRKSIIIKTNYRYENVRETVLAKLH